MTIRWDTSSRNKEKENKALQEDGCGSEFVDEYFFLIFIFAMKPAINT